MLLALSAQAQMPTIVSPEWLAKHQQDDQLVILHVSHERANYEAGHIAGARYVDPDSYVFTSDDMVQVYDRPPLSELEALFESLGLTPQSKIVAYPSTVSHLAVTRLVVTLYSLGWEGQAAILSGGNVAWEAEGYSMTSTEANFAPSQLFLKYEENFWVEKSRVAQAIESPTKVVDCRAEAYYLGVDVSEHHSGGRRGHVPGAQNVSYLSLFENSQGFYQYESEATLAQRFADAGLQKDDEIILYCHIGLQLTSVYVAARQLGYHNVRVYDGSFHEWGPDTSQPVSVD